MAHRNRPRSLPPAPDAQTVGSVPPACYGPMMEEVPPPWIALPDMDPWEPATHGMPEVYIALNWWPYWNTLTPSEKAAYLDRWNASEEWRDVIKDRYDPQDIDYEAEAREAAEWRAANVDHRPPRRWWQWWRRW